MLDWISTEVVIGALTLIGVAGAALHRFGLLPFFKKQPEKVEQLKDIQACPDPGCKQELKDAIGDLEKQERENHDELTKLSRDQKTLFNRLDRFERKIEGKVDEALKVAHILCGAIKKGNWNP